MTKPIRSKYLEDAPVKDYVKEMLKHVALEDLQRKFEAAYADQIKKLFEVFLVKESLNTYNYQLKVPLKQLGIRPAILDALNYAGIKTVSGIVQFSPNELRRIPGISNQSIKQIYDALRQEGVIK